MKEIDRVRCRRHLTPMFPVTNVFFRIASRVAPFKAQGLSKFLAIACGKGL
jgi:hypothetical protein